MTCPIDPQHPCRCEVCYTYAENQTPTLLTLEELKEAQSRSLLWVGELLVTPSASLTLLLTLGAAGALHLKKTDGSITFVSLGEEK